MRHAICLLLLLGLALAAPACTIPIPTPSCPDPPAARDFGPRPARAAQSSIDIELGELYVRHRIQQSLAAPSGQDSGVSVKRVSLEERGAGDQRTSLVAIDIQPWLTGADGTPVAIERSYRLRLRLEPYLITPATIADAQRRRALLCPDGQAGCTADSGVLLAFEFEELFSNADDAPVSCTSPKYNLIDERVLRGIYESVGRQAPLVLPAAQVTGMVSQLAGAPVNLIGVNISASGGLKIGLLLDRGTPHAFDTAINLSGFHPNSDWGIWVDKTFVSAAVARSAASQAPPPDPTYPKPRIDLTSVTFTDDGFEIDISGVLPVCGDIPFSSHVVATPQVCTSAAGTSVLRACTGAPETTVSPSDLQKLCYPFDWLVRHFNVGIVSDPAAPNSCTVMGELSFAAGPDDQFYATALDTYDRLYIAGRSSFEDRYIAQQQLPPRPPAPPSCPN